MRLAAPLVLTALLLLGGCAFILDSPFPPYVPLLREVRDVGDVMPYERGGHYELRVFDSASREYVWLYGEGRDIGERFALFDEDLKLLIKDREAAGEDTFYGQSTVMVNGTYVCVGKRVYDATTLELEAAYGSFIDGWGYYDPAAGVYVFPYMSSASDVVNRNLYSNPWTPAGGGGYWGTISGGLYTYDGLVGLGHDVRGDRLGIYARRSGTNTIDGVIRQAANFWTSVTNPILSDPGAFTIDARSSEFDGPYFVGDGTVIRYRDEDVLVFYGLDGSKESEVPIRDSGETAHGFSPSGKSWYIFVAETGRLMKARTWW